MVATITIKRIRHKKLAGKISGPTKIEVGFPAGTSSGENIQKAIWNEFGTRGGASGGGWGGPIPERPFMRNAIRDNQAKYRNQLKRDAAKLLTGELDTALTLGRLGEVAVGDIKQEIIALKSPPNSPVTIARKGSDDPLIDTGDMLNDVGWKFE